jgi:16S rRNA (cytosine967-C5)-methyltransferase
LVKPPEDPRALAYAVLFQVDEKGAYADRVLDGRLRSQPDLDSRDRALATELVYGTLRRRGTIDRSLQTHLQRPLHRLDPEILRILRLGAYQILFLDRVPDHAAVNEAVTLARRVGRPGSDSLVNAVLRALCRAKPTAKEGPAVTAEQDYPEWLIRLWGSELGEPRARELFLALFEQPRTVLRVNRLKAGREELRERLATEGFAAEPIEELPDALVIAGGGDARKTACYQEGWFVLQDAASQLIVQALDPRPGERLLDLCAAPGIKTSQAAAVMENRGLVVAVDLHAARLRELSRLCARMGVTIARPLCADAGKPGEAPFSGRPFDRILVDAPCSGLGVLARNPERKWRPAPDFASLSRLQASMLESAALLLREGGVLLYSTCTVHRAENEMVVEAFLAEHRDFVREDIAAFLPVGLRVLCSEDGAFCSWNLPAFSDFFFAARMKRMRPRPVRV